jgi:undecaprenyl diphosphate synthase
VRDVVETSARLGIHVLTLYAFSVENWKRPATEVSTLMSLLKRYLRLELKTLLTNNIRFHVIGRADDLPPDVREELRAAERKTASCTGMEFNIALNYGGRAEIVDAARKAIEQGLKPDELDERCFAGLLYTAGQPDPDLLIRTSGEMRISNFLLWQIAYAEIWVTETLWPDFRRRHLFGDLDQRANGASAASADRRPAGGAGGGSARAPGDGARLRVHRRGPRAARSARPACRLGSASPRCDHRRGSIRPPGALHGAGAPCVLRCGCSPRWPRLRDAGRRTDFWPLARRRAFSGRAAVLLARTPATRLARGRYFLRPAPAVAPALRSSARPWLLSCSWRPSAWRRLLRRHAIAGKPRAHVRPTRVGGSPAPRPRSGRRLSQLHRSSTRAVRHRRARGGEPARRPGRAF